MNDGAISEFPARFEAEIALAERSYDLILERLASGRLPDSAVPKGDVHALIDAVGELLHLEALENDGRSISQKRIEKSVASLQVALERVSSWPPVPRTLAIAPLVETLEELEIEWIAVALILSLSGAELMDPDERQAVEVAIRRIVPVQVRIAIGNHDWAPDFEVLVRRLREVALDEPDNDELRDTLRRAVVYNALRGRAALVEEARRALVAAEPLPGDLADALEELSDEFLDSELYALSLHLLIADLVEAGLAPDRATPRQVVGAAFIAHFDRDNPDENLDVRQVARWASSKVRQLETLVGEIEPVFEWTPAGCEGPIEARQHERWLLASQTIEFMPARWVPARDSTTPPYRPAAARKRFAELRDVVWMMIDPLEPVRFVSEVFRYGDGAPDEIEVELLREIIDLWQAERLIDTAELEEGADFDDDWDDDDGWLDELPGEQRDFPTLVTTDGEPLVFATAEYEVAEDAHDDIVRRLDGMEELQREQEDGSERWVWLETRPGGEIVIAGLGLEAGRLRVETQSVARSARVAARLVDELGELIVLLDLNTRRPTPGMSAGGISGPPGGGDPADIPPEEQRRVVHEMLERHYRSWPDESVPALGGMTPREAVGDPDVRPQVIALLREFEERNGTAPEAMRDFDFGFLWDELGLDRGDR